MTCVTERVESSPKLDESYRLPLCFPGAPVFLEAGLDRRTQDLCPLARKLLPNSDDLVVLANSKWSEEEPLWVPYKPRFQAWGARGSLSNVPGLKTGAKPSRQLGELRQR